MITITLQRYYGDTNITKSTVCIADSAGNTLMECEARECGYKQYKRGEVLAGSQHKCLGEGEYELIPSNDEMNPICLKITHEPSRRGYKICALSTKFQYRIKRVLIGYADSSSPPELREMTDIDACRDAFMNVIYQHYGEEFRLRIEN